VLAALLLTASHASAQGIVSEWNAVTPPPPPGLSTVTLDPATTALLVLDIAQQTCNAETRPRCLAMLPTVAKLLDHARARKWTVIYTLGAASKPADILPQVAMLGSEPIVIAPPDKFIGTNLEALLKERGIKTVVTVGAAAEGAILHTAATAAFRGFDVVVPVDGMASGSLYAEQYVAWDLRNAPRLGGDRVKLSDVAMIE
jgi:nicotinamidase-related amidase